MKKVIRLTESDLTRIVKRIINEIGDYDMELITKHDGKVIDSVIHNGYELALIQFPDGKTISLTYNNKGYFKPKEQMKQPMEYEGRDILKIFRQFKPYVVDWVNNYNDISVGSTNKKRVGYYHKWLCEDLECSGIRPKPGIYINEPQYYFTIKNR